MDFLTAAGVSLAYSVTGAGPGLLIPRCNFAWSDLTYVEVLSDHFTVVVASPRGYGLSTRMDDGLYTVAMLADDLLAVTDAVDLRQFAVLGYSLSGAVAAWLALATERVNAVVAGGFPLLGSYTKLFDDVVQRDDEIRHDQTRRESIDADFDGRAAVAFYRHLAGLPDGALVDRLRCPLLSFCGGNDEVIEAFGSGAAALEVGLHRRGHRTIVLPGLDHLGALLSPGAALPTVVDWISAPAGSPS